mgnify:CR=1 FL=1
MPKNEYTEERDTAKPVFSVVARMTRIGRFIEEVLLIPLEIRARVLIVDCEGGELKKEQQHK